MSHSHTELTGSDGTAQLSENERHRLLSDERRRTALFVLRERSCPVELEELATAVLKRLDDIQDTADAHERMMISLHHTHLPMLADLGLIEYDQKRSRVVSCHA